MEEKACLCALNRIFGFEPKYGLALIRHLGSASEVFRLDEKDLYSITGPHFKYKGSICRKAADAAGEELIRLEQNGIRFCGWTEDDYPSMLRECEDAPIGLYMRCTTHPGKIWSGRTGISIVGTRDISPYGKEWCGKIVSRLSSTEERPCIVSGLALGTDIMAHRTALENGLPTVGVMATGPDAVYPWRHREIAEQMAGTPGCALITDYPPGTAPLAIHFLRRNRIIAGLGRATLLIESKLKGGGMMTCRLAFSYNRDVYALPGKIDDLRSQGCNELIRQKIAEPVTSLERLIESLGMKSGTAHRSSSPEDRVLRIYSGKMDENMLQTLCRAIRHIRSERGISVEDLAARLGISYRETSEIVGLLEIEGFISIDILHRCSINYKND